LGSEAVCVVHYGGRACEGRALLETSEVIFRGDFRLRIPFSDVTSISAEDGELRLGYAGDIAVFDLGRDAATWADKIKNPRDRLDKLGLKAEMRVAVLGLNDPGFVEQLQSRGVTVVHEIESGGLDVVFYEADTLPDLDRLPELRAAIQPAGAVWVVSPKGKGIEVRDVDVMAAARGAGLVDNKVVGFSATDTALRLVIPQAQRPTKR
jgi:hypothetical protein